MIPNKVPSEVEVATEISSRLGVCQDLVLDILNLMKSKKELGVTTDKIRVGVLHFCFYIKLSENVEAHTV